MVDQLDTIEILGKKWCKVQLFEQMKHQDGRAIPRREGLAFFMRYLDDSTGHSVMIQQKVNRAVDPRWLKEAIDKGYIYLEAYDYEITLAAAKAAKNR